MAETETETKKSSMREVRVDDLAKAGLSSPDEAEEIAALLQAARAGGWDPVDTWREVVGRRVLKPWHPHGVHQLVYGSVYAHCHWGGSSPSSRGPPLYWVPSP